MKLKHMILFCPVVFIFFQCTTRSDVQVEGPKPNIIFILADDLGYGDLSSYGATKVQRTVKAGSESDKIVALTDILATMAEYTGYELEWNTGEDSFSFLHELEGREPVKPVRENVVVDATSGLIGMRKGPWKFITGQGGGGVHWNPDENVRILTHTWNYPENVENPPGQLYNLEEDPGETNNLYYENFDKVVELRALLREIKYSGRSRQ